MSSDRTPILNLADAPQHSSGHGEHFACSISELAGPLGARSIGANVTRVPPGKAAFPIHHHHANEEHFFVLSGHGTLRLGSQVYPVKPRDYIVHPAGGPEVAHQLVNTGDEDLVYLAISTLVLPEVVGYPDSGKTGVRPRAGQEPGTRFLVKDDDKTQVGYWDDEDGRHVRALLERQIGSVRGTLIAAAVALLIRDRNHQEFVDRMYMTYSVDRGLVAPRPTRDLPGIAASDQRFAERAAAGPAEGL